MIRKFLTLIMAGAAIGLPAGNITVRIDTGSKSPIPIEDAAGEGDMTVKPSNSGNGMVAVFPVTAEWKRYQIAFKAGQSGRIRIAFFAVRPQYGGASVAVARLEVNGRPVPNQDYSRLAKNGRPAGFAFAKNAKQVPELIPASGDEPAAVRVAFSRSLILPLSVEAGQVYRVGFDLKELEPYPEDKAALNAVRSKKTVKPKYPVYDNQRIAKPEGIRELSAKDFKIDPARVRALKRQKNSFGPIGILGRLGEYFMNDKAGQSMWRGLTSRAARIVNQWDFVRSRFGAQRYTYATGSLRSLALIYAMTGNPELGRFIRMHMLQIADLPMEFWLHSELRGYHQPKPRGALETSALSETVAKVLSTVGDELFSAKEKKHIEEALREKGHNTLRNWVEYNRERVTNNFMAVIASGLFVSADYFKDAETSALALNSLKNYLEKSIEDDGSYGEGPSYFAYPVGAMVGAVGLMTPDERASLYGRSALRNSSRWMASQYFYSTSDKGKLVPMRLAFGDNGYLASPNAKIMLLFANCYNDPLAVWLIETFKNNPNWRNETLDTLLLNLAFGKSRDVAAKSPQELDLPLLGIFDNGETIMRGSWQPDAPVLGMKASRPCKVNYGHNRPESNSIAFAAYGEYFVVQPNSASYRSPIHKSWDCSTKSANTVLVDGMDQGLREVKANAKQLVVEETPDYLLAAQDSANCHRIKINRAVRIALLLRKLDTVVLIDRYEAPRPHKYEALLHFFNRDEASKLDERGEGSFVLTRPRADLAVFIGSDQELKFRTAPGYMHRSARDYSPGGPNEGKLGSSLELGAAPSDKVQDVTFFTVLQPLKKGKQPLPVELKGDTLSIGNEKISFKSGKLTVNGAAKQIF